MAGRDLREVAERTDVEQASKEDLRRFGEELLPLNMYPPKPELLATFFSRTIQNEELSQYMEERLRNEYDVRSQLAEIRVPTLILQGRYVWVLSILGAEEMAQKIPHAQLYIFDQASHFIHLDAPEEFFQVIRTFLGASLTNEIPPTLSE